MMSDIRDKLAVIRGAGDIATGIGHRLYRSGFNIIFLDTDAPTVVRRKVAFAEAVYNGEITVEGLKGKLASNKDESLKLLEEGILPIIIDPKGKSIKELEPKVVVDAILAKKNLGTNRDMAEVVIGVGPGFEAGKNVDAVVETKRGHMLGKVILEGKPEPNTGIPGNILGYTDERVLKGNNSGNIKVLKNIGSIVKKGEVVASIDGVDVMAKIDGVIRGMIRDNYPVKLGMKIGDVDPRGEEKYCYLISDKARAVGGGVLEAILHILNRRSK
ncbi:EF2563 family selenium-dependent molybdenum hydroxylase system protein [Clostridium sp. D2Q-14]|uniref:selenium-dependent molybdenum cofactor biosynthesis protein YqeB n=1 Tax=Anaeromonas gelatinilytica TaxID=2683194 RepID=UPI00193B9E50|nr:selenium-dependent molybdenum cofactor biosynthesis protein YqeB [Anaeromonas gelatinilytica]MBS4534570.1 EF2563 family selenium-dependent molybdenum hydroxylase system protein [Anaeromonas gelatinilytica]